MSLSKKKGFTIVELVIVIAVIAILAAVLIPTFSNVINNANESAALQEAKIGLQALTAQLAKEGKSLDGIYTFAVTKNSTIYYFNYTKSGSTETGLAKIGEKKSTDTAAPTDAQTKVTVANEKVPDIPSTVTITCSEKANVPA